MNGFNLKQYGIDIGLLVSGLFGAILLTSKNSSQNLTATIMSLIGGAASANYLTPIVMSFTSAGNSSYQYGVAFLLGFLGLKGIEYFSWKIISPPNNQYQVEDVQVRKKRKKRKKKIVQHVETENKSEQ